MIMKLERVKQTIHVILKQLPQDVVFHIDALFYCEMLQTIDRMLCSIILHYLPPIRITIHI